MQENQAKDIVLRERSLEDRRVINIVLTDYGKLVVEKMPVIAINVLNEHLQNFDPDEITTLKRLLTKLIYESENKGCEEKAQSDNAVEGKK